MFDLFEFCNDFSDDIEEVFFKFVVVVVGWFNVGKFIFVNCIFGCRVVVVQDVLGVICD